MWNAEHEAHNQGLLKRQDTLAAAWSALPQDQSAGDDNVAFRKGWMAARAAALRKSGQSGRDLRVGGRQRLSRRRCGSRRSERVRARRSRGAARAHARRRLALDAGRRRGADHLPVRQPAVRPALLRRLHAAQHRVLLRAGAGDAAVRVRHLSRAAERAPPGSRRLVRRGAVRRHRRRPRCLLLVNIRKAAELGWEFGGAPTQHRLGRLSSCGRCSWKACAAPAAGAWCSRCCPSRSIRCSPTPPGSGR